MPAIPKPAAKKKATTSSSGEDAFLWAIGQQESGGGYKRVNSSSGALGKYQVMPYHLKGGNEWAGRTFGRAVSRTEFLNSPAMQEQMAHKILGGYYRSHGPAGAAALWYSGQSDPTKTYGNPPVYKYVNSVLALMRRAPKNAGDVPGDVSGGSGGSGGSSSGDATQAGFGSTDKPADCLFGFSVGVGYVCVLTKGQGRALLGSLLLVAGGIVSAGGLIILSAYGLKKSGALDQVAAAAAVVPGAGGLAAKAASGSAKLKAGPKPKPKAPAAPPAGSGTP